MGPTLPAVLDDARRRGFVGRSPELRSFTATPVMRIASTGWRWCRTGSGASARSQSGTRPPSPGAGWLSGEVLVHAALPVRGVAERWLSADDVANFREWSGRPESSSVVARLGEPGALTAALGIHRAALPPSTLFSPRRDVAGIDSRRHRPTLAEPRDASAQLRHASASETVS